MIGCRHIMCLQITFFAEKFSSKRGQPILMGSSPFQAPYRKNNLIQHIHTPDVVHMVQRAYETAGFLRRHNVSEDLRECQLDTVAMLRRLQSFY